MSGKLNAAIAGLVIASGCAVPDSDTVVEHPQSISELDPVKGKKSCSFYRPNKEECDGLTDAERAEFRRIIESTKLNLIQGLRGTQEGVHSGSFIDSGVFTPFTFVSSPDENTPFAVSCASEADGSDFNKLVPKVINDARSMIAPGMEKIGENFTNEMVNLDLVGKNLIACGRTEMNKKVKACRCE